MHDFDYQTPDTLQKAEAAFKAASEPALLAGGQTLIPTLKHRLAEHSDLIDLAGIADLKGIREDGENIVIGAMTTHCDVAESELVSRLIPALASLAGEIGDPQVRHRGTIGGSVSNNDPAADYPAACLGFGATIHTSQRTFSADDFFIDTFETALEEGEILTAVSFPVPERAAYIKFPNPASRYALVGVMVAKTKDGVRVAVTGAGSSVFRDTAIEDALNSSFTAEAITGSGAELDSLNSDIHASQEYRKHLIGVMAKRGVAAANA